MTKGLHYITQVAKYPTTIYSFATYIGTSGGMRTDDNHAYKYIQ